jgi:hypothetical protein
MTINDRARRTAGLVFLGIGALGASGAAFFTQNGPARASVSVGLLATPISCSATGSTACFNVTNTKTGAGIAGTSSAGAGIRGTSTSGTGVKAVSQSSYGVTGHSSTGPAAVFGTMDNGLGVLGSVTASGTGVMGTSTNGYGVYGSTTGNGIGVVGYQASAGTGLYGFANSGYGVNASTSTGYALNANAASTGTALYATSGTGYGLIARTGGSVAVYGRNTSGNGADFEGSYIGLLGRSPTTGFPLTLTDSNGNNLFYVDGSGNVSYHGGLFPFARTRNGAMATAFGSKSTEPTMEDTGTAQLRNGAAVVVLDAVFAASIDAGVPYRVFVTPGGDTRGLFVQTKTPSSFVVRESQGGRSTVSFDYRIVATALGHARERMAFAAGEGSGPNAKIPNAPTVRETGPLSSPGRR